MKWLKSKNKFIISSFCAVLLILTGSLFSQQLWANNSVKIIFKDFASKNKNVRVTVSNFSNTAGTALKYDRYIAETLLHALSQYKELRLVERSRLTSVINELKLQQTGMISAKDAVQIGNLLPVDIILTGTYTIIDNKIKIYGRFINVVSGEILETLSFELPVDKVTTVKTLSPKEACELKQKEIVKLLYDLSSKKRVENCVAKATAIPFDNDCGKIHHRVMSTFKRYKVYPESYRVFLLKTLKNLNQPSIDFRAMDIMKYLTHDGRVDNEEWKVFVSVIKRSNSRTIHNYLHFAFNYKVEKLDIIKKRVKEIMSLGKKGVIGRPVPFTQHELFFDVMSGLGASYRYRLSPAVWAFDRYSVILGNNEKDIRKALRIVNSIYFNKITQAERKILRKRMIAFLREKTKSEKSVYYLYNMLYKFRSKLKSNDGDKGIFKKDAEVISSALSDWICFGIKSAGYKSQKKRRREIAEFFKVKCPQ